MADYYVATTGSNGGAGTFGDPWETLHYAAGQVSAGDDVYVRTGTYTSFAINGKNGTSGNYITFQPYNNEVVTIDPYYNSNNYANSDDPIHVINSSYIETKDFELTDSNPFIDSTDPAEYASGDGRKGITFMNSSHHCRLSGCNIHHLFTTGSGSEPTTHHLEILNNTIHTGKATHRGYGLYHSGDNDTIKGNIIYDCAGYGIHVWSSQSPLWSDNNLIEDNICFNNGLGDYSKGWTGQYYDFGHAVGSGILVGGEGAMSGNVIQNNLCYGNYLDGIAAYTYAHGTLVINNTVYNHTNVNSVGIRIRNNNDSIVRNNISYANTVNYYDATATNVTETNNLFGTDPVFVDAASDDFHLQSGSPAIDAGISTGAPPTDLDGVIRPQGAEYDIGAYEYVLSSIGGIIIDNGDTGTSFTGNWIVSSGANPYGTDSLYANDTADYTFTANSINGNYKISMWWTWWANRQSSINVEIYDGVTLLDTVVIDQTISGDAGKWNSLGTYTFTGTAKIKILAVIGGTTCADAVKIFKGSAFKFYDTFANYRRCLLIR